MFFYKDINFAYVWKLLMIVQEVVIGKSDALFEFDGVFPAKGMQPGNIHKLAWCAIGLAAVEREAAFITCYLFHQKGEVFDGQVFSCSYIYQAGFIVVLH